MDSEIRMRGPGGVVGLETIPASAAASLGRNMTWIARTRTLSETGIVIISIIHRQSLPQLRLAATPTPARSFRIHYMAVHAHNPTSRHPTTPHRFMYLGIHKFIDSRKRDTGLLAFHCIVLYWIAAKIRD